MDYSRESIKVNDCVLDGVDNDYPFEREVDEVKFRLSWENLTVRTTPKSYKLAKKIVRKFTTNPEPEGLSIDILNSASGYAEAGHMIAIMGPRYILIRQGILQYIYYIFELVIQIFVTFGKIYDSGAGKTTLLGALAKRIEATSGTININGIVSSSREMSRISSYVPQFDHLPATLTVKEYIAFSCALRLEGSTKSQQRECLARDIILNLSLHKCKDTLTCTLSGGEKKRLSLAAEIVTKPRILFLDEPTTGLDTSAALHVIELIKPISTSGIVLCSIHQPSMMIYNLFSHVIFLTNGKTAFSGSLENAKIFFQRFVKQAYGITILLENKFTRNTQPLTSLTKHLYPKTSLPENISPAWLMCPSGFDEAEYYVKILSNKNPENMEYSNDPTSIASYEHSTRICRAYADSNFAKIPSTFHGSRSLKIVSSERGPRWIVQFNWLLWRLYLENRRTFVDGLIAFNYYAISVIFIVIFFWGIDSHKQRGIQDTMGALYMASAEMIFSTAYTPLYEIEREIPIYLREAAMYSPSAYYVATSVSWIPKTVLKSFLLSIMLFLILGTRDNFFPTFFQFSVCTIATGICGTAYGAMIASFIENNEIATIFMVPIDLIALLMSGIYYSLRTLKWYTVGFKYLSIFYYTNEALAIAHWSQIDDIECDSDSNLHCMTTGSDVLRQYGFEESNFWTDILGMIVLTFLMNFIGYVGMKRRRSLISHL